jgi:5-methyltetrahydrofolate--homocysteine methyltransferase
MNLDFTGGVPMAAQIYQMLRRAIVTTELKPGQNLSELELATQLNVSRQPVREAFIKLRETGLVKILPQRGTYVVGISMKSMLDAQFIRECLERALVLDVTGKTDAEFEKRMQRIMNRQAAAAEKDDWTEFVVWDDAFHRAFAEFSGRERTWRVIESEKAHLDRVRYLTYRGQAHINKMIEQHKSILESVIQGDRQKAEKAVHWHLSQTLESLPGVLEEHSDLFEEEDIQAGSMSRLNERLVINRSETMALNDVFQAVLGFDESKVVELVKAELDAGTKVGVILNDGLIAAMDQVGQKFSAGELFVPEMLMAAQAMKGGLEVLRPLLSGADTKPRGTVVIGTVKGDLHDIGKNLVAMMLEGAGFTVVDLGVDVEVEKFVAAAKENDADLVALSALLTTTMPAMESCVASLKEQGVGVKSIIGGAPVTQDFADKIGADGYAQDAPGAVALARSLSEG